MWVACEKEIQARLLEFGFAIHKADLNRNWQKLMQYLAHTFYDSVVLF